MNYGGLQTWFSVPSQERKWLMDNFLPLHVICSPKEEYLGIITAYIPTLDKWENDFKTRRRSR